MDATTIAVAASLITSVGAIILGLAGIAAQHTRDTKLAKADQDKADKQAELDKGRLGIDKDKAADEAYQTMIDSLRAEVTRLHDNEARDRARILELEDNVLQKTTKIGELMLAKIDAESTAATMKYKLDTLQLKLNMMLETEKTHEDIQDVSMTARKKQAKKEDTVPLAVKKTLLANEEKKARITEEMNQEIESFKSGSLANLRDNQGE